MASSSLLSNTELEDELEAGRTSLLDAISASGPNDCCGSVVEVILARQDVQNCQSCRSYFPTFG